MSSARCGEGRHLVPGSSPTASGLLLAVEYFSVAPTRIVRCGRIGTDYFESLRMRMMALIVPSAASGLWPI
jgi:hypothetical protein